MLSISRPLVSRRQAGLGDIEHVIVLVGEEPFNANLAAEFTSCDAYFAAARGPSDLNLRYLFGGSVRQAASYPERLARAGVSSRIYQNSVAEFVRDCERGSLPAVSWSSAPTLSELSTCCGPTMRSGAA